MMLECHQMIEIELKIRMDTLYRPKNAMVVSELQYFDLLKAMTCFDIKYDFRFHNIAKKFIQMMLEGQQMI